jgi:CheY-like chemotaxis protein
LLTVILGYADGIGYSQGKLDPSIAAKEIRGAAERASGLTRDLLAFARRQPSVPTTFDLNEVIARSLRLLERLAGEDVSLELALSPEPCAVRADVSQIERVLVNLVVNARDAQPGGGRISIETRLGAREGRKVAKLVVSDPGAGMAPNVLAHLFEPFFSTKGSGKGSGLGLPTVYGLVSQLGGQISVTSAVDAGTRVEIELPLAIEAPIRSTAPPLELEAVGRGRGETILLAEDEAGLRAFLRDSLEQRGYVVLEAADGRAAISLIESHPGPIHVLITDVVMPDASGFDVAARLRATREDPPVIYMSGYLGNQTHLSEIERAGVILLTKPFRIRDLEATLEKALSPRPIRPRPEGAA